MSHAIYRMRDTATSLESSEKFFIPAKGALVYIKALFSSYQLEVNRTISSPQDYGPYDIENNPLRIRLDESLEELSREIYLSKQISSNEIKNYSEKIRDIKETLRDYNVSALAIIEAFSGSDKSVSGLTEFMSMLTKSESEIMSGFNSLGQKWDDEILVQRSVINRKMGTITTFLLLLWILFLFSLFVFVTRARKLSDYVQKFTSFLSRSFGSEHESIEIKSITKKTSYKELLALSGEAMKASELMKTKIMDLEDKIEFLDNSNLKNKIFAQYASSILDSVEPALFVTDDLLKVSFVNKGFENLWKVRRDHVVDTEVSELPFIRVVDGWSDALSKALVSDERKGLYSFEGEFKVSTKTIKKLEFRVMPLRDSKRKNILGTISMIREL